MTPGMQQPCIWEMCNNLAAWGKSAAGGAGGRDQFYDNERFNWAHVAGSNMFYLELPMLGGVEFKSNINQGDSGGSNCLHQVIRMGTGGYRPKTCTEPVLVRVATFGGKGYQLPGKETTQ